MAKYRKNDDGTYTYEGFWNSLLDSAGDLFSIGVNKAGGADIDTTEGQRAAQRRYDSERWGKFLGGTDPTYTGGSYRDYLMNPNFNRGNLYKAVSDFGIDTDSDAYDSAIKGIFTDRVDSVPFGYNTADAGGIFDSMAKIPGSTFGGTYAALGAYNLMDINEGMANYVKNQANDPLTKDNLKPFVTSSDSGFINPLAAENGAIVNYGKVQAEKDEIIVLPDGSIVEPASKTFHNKMDSDEVTEYLPQGSIVFSNKVMVKKSAFEGKKGDVVAASVANYTETEKPELPIEFKISELFGSKKEMSSAELIKEVKRRFPIKEVQDNGTENPKLTPIDKQTNEQNKLARIPYITAIFDKVKNKMKTDTTDNPVKANAGVILAAAQAGGNILGALGSQYMNYLNTKKNRELLKKWYDTSNANLNTGAAIGMLSALVNPYIPKKNIDAQRDYLNEMPDKVPYYLQDSAYNQLSADSNMRTRSLFENTTSFNKAANAASAYDVNALDAKSRLATNFASQNMGLQNAKLNAQLGYEEKWAGEEQNRISKILQNINAIKANLGDQGVNYFNQKNALESGLTNAKVAQNTAYANSTAGNFQTLMSGGAQAASQLAGASSAPQVTAPTSGDYGSNMGISIDNTNYTGTIPTYEEAGVLPSREKVQYDFYNQLANNAYSAYNPPNPTLTGTSQINPFKLTTLNTQTILPNTGAKATNRLAQAQELLSYNLSKEQINYDLNNKDLNDPTYKEALKLVQYYVESPNKLNNYTQDELVNAFQIVRNKLHNEGSGELNFGTYNIFDNTQTDSRLYNYDWLKGNIR